MFLGPSPSSHPDCIKVPKIHLLIRHMTKDWTINIGWLLCAVRYSDDLNNQYILSITIFIIKGSFHFSKVDHLPFFARSFTKNCLYAGHTPVRKIIYFEFLSLFKGWNPRWCRRSDSWWSARHCLGRRWRLDWTGGSIYLSDSDPVVNRLAKIIEKL